MTVRGLKDVLKKYGRKLKPDTEITLRLDSGDYTVSEVDFDGSVLRLYSPDEAKTQTFRVSYVITKDHKTVAYGTARETAVDENDIIFAVDELQEKYLREYGVKSEEKSEKTGSVIVEEPTPVTLFDSDGKIVGYELSESEKHYYNCRIIEIMKEIDETNDIYVRVWKNGKI